MWFDSSNRFHAWLKILLPLSSLILLSTIFMFARDIDLMTALPFSERRLYSRAAEQQITAPFFVGATPDGALVWMSASRARPDPEVPQRTKVDSVWARLHLNSGEIVHMRSAFGVIDSAEAIASLRGNVRILSTDGFSFTTDELVSKLNHISARSDGPVQGNGPPGMFVAGRMQMTSNEDSGALYWIFTDGVKLVYQPTG